MTYDLWDIRPQIHILTNYITVNDVVNACLSVGATAIGGDALCECAQITENCDRFSQRDVKRTIERGSLYMHQRKCL